MIRLSLKHQLLFFFTLIFIAIMWFYLPLQDNLTYFDFADKRPLSGIHNAGDVLSNIAFFFVSLRGFKHIFHDRQLNKEYTHAVLLISMGAMLTCFGSAYFHNNPTNETLFWDRLPMTIGFSGAVTLLITDRINSNLGYICSFYITLLSALTVIGWNQGWLTLRPYLSVQYGCLIFVFLTIIFTKSNLTQNKTLLSALILYLLAKIAELFDQPIFALTQLISGHTLKHLLAAIALYNILNFPKVKHHDS